MSVEILNLDSFVSEPRKVSLKGKEIVIPGDTSVEYFFRVLKNAQDLKKEPESAELAEEAFRNIFDLIKPLNNNIDYTWLKANLTIGQYMRLVAFINNQYGPVDEKKTAELSGDTNGE
jgi:hypothetical protein